MNRVSLFLYTFITTILTLGALMIGCGGGGSDSGGISAPPCKNTGESCQVGKCCKGKCESYIFYISGSPGCLPASGQLCVTEVRYKCVD